MIDVINSTSSIYSLKELNFSCGVQQINDFFAEKAIKFEKSKISTTLLFLDNETGLNKEEKLKGFISFGLATIDTTTDVSAKIELESLEFEKGDTAYGNIEKTKLFPVIALNYFAVSDYFQRKQFGTFMMLYFFEMVIELSVEKHISFIGIVVSSLSDSTDFYEKLGFTYLGSSPNDINLKEYRMFITIDKIIEAHFKFKDK